MPTREFCSAVVTGPLTPPSAVQGALASACLGVMSRAHGVALTPSASSRGRRGTLSPPNSSRHRPHRNLVAPKASKNDASDAMATSLKNILGFFKERVDSALEDKDEAAISAIVGVGGSTGGGATNEVNDDERSSIDQSEINYAATWAVDLQLFLRDPVASGPIDKRSASRTERAYLTLEITFAPRDEGMFPSRGAAFVKNSRFFETKNIKDDYSGAYWIADEPGFFKFTLPATTPLTVSGVTCVPQGEVLFNGKIKMEQDDDGVDESSSSENKKRMKPSLVSGVATIKRDVPASFMGANYSGILAEYIIVGTFTANRR